MVLILPLPLGVSPSARPSALLPGIRAASWVWRAALNKQRKLTAFDSFRSGPSPLLKVDLSPPSAGTPLLRTTEGQSSCHSAALRMQAFADRQSGLPGESLLNR